MSKKLDPPKHTSNEKNDQMESYSKQLRSFITSPESDMMLDAEKAYAVMHSTETLTGGPAVFELFKTGLAASKVIKIWEILNHQNEYIECIEMLAHKAKQIYDETPFSSIVTATPMGSELAIHVQDWMRTHVNKKVGVCHLIEGIETGSMDNTTEHVAGKNVIVLTDVVITGRRLQHVCKKVIDQGGIPVSVLSVVTISPSRRIQVNKHHIPLYTLTDIRINLLKDEDYDHNKAIPIDYSKIMWDMYRIKLRQFITSDISGMVFDADKNYESKYPGKKSEGKAVFKLHSGHMVKQFVSIWEMFDHGERFRKCMDMLSLKAFEIHERTHFARIVTCTPTAKELANHVLNGLRKRTDDEISIYHFGDYHPHGLRSPQPDFFEDEPVLILTDMVSTGMLVKGMGEQIIKHGGRPVAVLTVGITDRERTRIHKLSMEEGQIELSNCSPLLHSLTDVPIDVVPEGEYDPTKIIPIDYASVLPIEEHMSTGQYNPEFNTNELLNLVESANAIDFSFYNFDEKRFTTSFVISRLLEKHGDIIWSKIKDPILNAAIEQRGQPLIVVSSYKQMDLLFKDFVQNKLRAEKHESSTVVALKRGIKDSDYLSLTFGEERSGTKSKTDLINRTVVLLLGTLTTAEKLRSIVTLLLAQNVRKVTVVCLLNRMGTYTTSFISAIARFARRVTTESLPSETTGTYVSDEQSVDTVTESGKTLLSKDILTGFEFHMVFSHLDLASENLLKMHDLIDRELIRFMNLTKSDALRRVAGRMSELFTPISAVVRSFHKTIYNDLDKPFELNIGGTCMRATSHEGKIAVITQNLILYHDYEPVFNELTHTLDSMTIIHLIGLLLADIDYLHFNGSLQRVAQSILERIRTLRIERFALEKGCSGASNNYNIKNRIKKIVDTEAHLLFVLGIVANHEPALTFQNIMLFKELLLCGKSQQEWFNAKNNLKYHFTNERVFFAISFLIHALHPDFSKRRSAEKSAEQLKREIVRQVHSFRRGFKAQANEWTKNDTSEKLQDLIARVNGNLEQLLTETGSYEHLPKHRVIRYLHREILRPRINHNTVLAGLRPLMKSLDELFEGKDLAPDIPCKMNRDILDSVNHAIATSVTMPIIAQNARRLFEFTPSVLNKQTRYTNPVSAEGLTKESDELLRRLQEILKRQTICKSDKETLGTIVRHYEEDITKSPLRDALQGYIVKLDDLVERSINDVCKKLSIEPLRDSLLAQSAVIKAKRDEGKCNWWVLCDYRLLHMTLQNIFHNIRHSFHQNRRWTIDSNLLHIDIDATTIKEEEFETTPIDAVRLQLTVFGGNPPNIDLLTDQAKTIGDQLNKLQEFKVEHLLKVTNRPKKYTITLILISRNNIQDSLQADQNRKEF